MARVGSIAIFIHESGRFPNLVGTFSLREVNEILSSKMGDEGLKVKEGPLWELSP